MILRCVRTVGDGVTNLSITPNSEQVLSQFVNWPGLNRVLNLSELVEPEELILPVAGSDPVEFVILPALMFDKWFRTIKGASTEAERRNLRNPEVRDAVLLWDAIKRHRNSPAKDRDSSWSKTHFTKLIVMHDPIGLDDGNEYFLSMSVTEPFNQLSLCKNNSRSWVPTVGFVYMR